MPIVIDGVKTRKWSRITLLLAIHGSYASRIDAPDARLRSQAHPMVVSGCCMTTITFSKMPKWSIHRRNPNFHETTMSGDSWQISSEGQRDQAW
jgi:hypothetical protein